MSPRGGKNTLEDSWGGAYSEQNSILKVEISRGEGYKVFKGGFAPPPPLNEAL